MCTVCAQLITFDTQCNLTPAPQFAVRTENGDASGGTWTSATMSVGDSFRGTIGFGGDSDWVAVNLTAGATYTLTMDAGTLDDPFLVLYGYSGQFIILNDDSGSGSNSLITYTATSTDTYYIAAEAFDFYADTGSYTLRVTQTAAPAALEVVSFDVMAEYLISGYWQDTYQPYGSFDTSRSNEITVNLSGLTAAGQQLARWAFEAWETVADINFVERGGSGADIQFTDDFSGAFAGATLSGSTAISATVNVSTNWLDFYGTTIDSYSLSTYIHEIGHALGLGHQGNYNGGGTFAGSAEFGNDSRQLSVMSYFETSENPNTNATPAELLSTMMVDIIAIQEIYGAPGSNGVTAGNTVWGADTNLTGLWSYIDSAILTNDRIPGVYSGTDMALTIYDQGGTDLLNLSTSITNDRVNMNDATFSDVGGIIGNLGIARDTVIENLEAGRGNDDITGNAAANIINGNSGNDTINSGGGDDTVRGGNGTDRLWGGDGNDLIFGQAGHDVIGGMDGADTIWGGTGNDTIWGGGWNDTIGGAQGNDSLMGDNGDDLFWGGDGNDTIEGGAHNDTLRGGSNNDLLRGGDGDDLVDGGWGWDRAFGDDGDDLVTGHYGNDLVSGGNGNDTVHGGAGDDTVWGDDGNDFVQGGAGNDIVLGGEGSDTILGGWGNDTLSGNSGADVFVFGYLDPGWDVITDFSAADGDVLRLDDILWRDTHGVLGKAAVLSTFSSVVNGALTFTFDMDEVLALNGVTTLSGNAFEIF